MSLPDVSELCVGSAFLGAVSYYRTSAQPNTQGLGAFDLGGFLYLFFLGGFVFFSLQVALGISDYRRKLAAKTSSSTGRRWRGGSGGRQGFAREAGEIESR